MKRWAAVLLFAVTGCAHHVPPVRVAAISDLHLGDPRSILDDADGRGVVLEALGQAIAQDHVHVLVLNGDVLELSLASRERAWRVAREFFEGLSHLEGLERVVFIPGNHDHRIYEELPGDPAEKLGHVFDSGTNVHRELDGASGKLRISVVYPDWAISLPQGNVHFTHGHYFDRSTTPSFDGAQSVAELEERNASWIAFITAGGSDPLTRTVYRSLYHFSQHFTGMLDALEGRDPDPVVLETSERTASRVSRYVSDVLHDDAALAVVAGHTHHAGGLATKIRVGEREVLFFDTGAFVASHTGLATHPQLFELDLSTAQMRLVPIVIPPELMQRAEDRAFSTVP